MKNGGGGDGELWWVGNVNWKIQKTGLMVGNHNRGKMKRLGSTGQEGGRRWSRGREAGRKYPLVHLLTNDSNLKSYKNSKICQKC